MIFDELLVARAEVADEIALRERDGVRGASRVRCSGRAGPQRRRWQNECNESKDMHFYETKGRLCIAGEGVWAKKKELVHEMRSKDAFRREFRCAVAHTCSVA